MQRLFPFVLAAAPLGLACEGVTATEPGADAPPGAGLGSAEEALLEQFPARGAAILSAEDGAFIEREGAFTSRRALAASGADDDGAASQTAAKLNALFPSTGEAPIRFETSDGAIADVRALGGGGEGERVAGGGALAYPRPGQISYWTATERGYEEWILVSEHEGDPIASWEIDGLEPRALAGGEVVLADAAGEAQILVRAPVAFGPGGDPVDVRLEVEDERIALFADASSGGPLLVDPIWEPVDDLREARSHHTAARITAFDSGIGPLDDESFLEDEGRVVVAGGYGEDGEPLGTSEVYVPEGKVWVPGDDLLDPRARHAGDSYTNTDVEDFRAFVAGGEGVGGDVLETVERYSAESGTWQLYGRLDTPRASHTADVVSVGSFSPEIVFVAGGTDAEGDITDSSEGLMFGESDLGPRLGGPMHDARRHHASVFDGSFRVVVTGGEGKDGTLASAELYDRFFLEAAAEGGTFEAPDSPWRQLPPMNEARKHHAMVHIPGGGEIPAGVVVIGGVGEGGEELESAEFLPLGGEAQWEPLEDMEHARSKHTATALPSGEIVVAGGTESETAEPEIFDFEEDEWSTLEDAPCIGEPRYAHTATLLEDESLLLAGGAFGEGDELDRLSSAERYDLDGGELEEGDACSADCQCESGYCVDGFCCDAACEGACEACDRDGDEGSCTPRDRGAEGTPPCADDLLCDGSEGSCPSACSEDEHCADDLLCEDGACVEAPECEVDGDCGDGEACEDGQCVPAPECEVDEDCESGEVCEGQQCVAEASAEGLIGWSCAASGSAQGGAAGAWILLIGLAIAARGRGKQSGADASSGRAGARAAVAGAACVLFALGTPGTAQAEETASAEAPGASGEVTEARAPGADPGLGGDAARDPAGEELGGPASRLRVGASVFGEGVAQNLGAEMGAGMWALPWLEIGGAVVWGAHPGGRLTATFEPFDMGAIEPFIQARGGLHDTDDGLVGAGGFFAGAAIDAGPGRVRAGFLGEYFGDPDEFHSAAAAGMVGYELGPAGREPAPAPEPIIRERVVEVEPDLPPPSQRIRGAIADEEGRPIDEARVELFAAGENEPLEVWEAAAEFERELDPGAYEIVVEAEEYDRRRRDLDVEEGETVVFALELAPAPAEIQAEVTEERIEIGERIRFELDSATLRPESHAVLDEVGRVLKEHDELEIRVKGHTDSTGDPEYNRTLSQRRADTVVRYLEDYGIAGERLQPEGFGDSQPVADNDTEEGRAQNRRVEFDIVGSGEAEEAAGAGAAE